MRKKEIIGEIKKIEFPNKSILIDKDNIYKFKGGIPGQKVKIAHKRRKNDYVEAKLIEVLEKSKLETNKTCDVFGVCGGCSYQSIPYEEEIKIKIEGIKDLYKDIYDKEIKVNPAISTNSYRNKMEYSFGDKVKDGPLVLGLHSRGRYYEITPTTNCNIVVEGFEIIRKNLEQYFRQKGKKFYKSRRHEGFLRHLVLKYSFSKDEFLINLVTSSQDDLDEREFVNYLKNISLKSKISTIIHTINDGLSDTVQADEIKILFGKGYIEEELLGLKFHIGPFSFFQPNPNMAKVLYTRALKLAGDISDKTVFDLYSGTGTIGQIFSKKAKRVYGIEIVEEAVEKAKETCKLNNITNCEFIQGDVLEKIEELKSLADIIVLDPPREGIHPKAIKKILNIKPEKFVYISCNPVTQARDLKIMLENGYSIENLEILDQFPRTSHLECIAMMVRK
ncbi:MAG: 23S rRNA (uracil(1939)-C(5))-methyltransferase RlmD [Lagierella massiliensis]|nr:23S rRNA (uracil(1939)-C(5))-methyltransferase RlmD [Lagierella massiliensis]